MDDQKRVLLAIVLSGVILLGWQYFFVPKPVESDTQAAHTQTETTTPTTVSKSNNNTVTPSPVATPEAPVVQTTQEYILKKGNVSFTINNNLLISDATNTNQKFSFEEIIGTKKGFQVFLYKEDGRVPLFFNLSQSSDSEISGSDSNYGINFSASIDESGKLVYSLNSEKNYFYQFVYQSKAQELESRNFSQFAYLTDELQTEQIGDEESGSELIKWIGIDYHYHLFAAIFAEKKQANYRMYESGKMVISFSEPRNAISLKMVFTKKEYDHLVKLGDNLHLSVDFGMFSIIAVPILRGLQFFYRFFPNYGVAIILLTLLMRLLTFPLQYKSFVSMKKMQSVQPELQKIREKFKDDPQRMQQESMALFKKAGANPLGGCLPLLLQMPIFFAFYKVLYAAVELVGAPFGGWLLDLSEKDPYYVLPVLMAVTMFAQQKLTPTATSDPTQKKVMMFMPLIFGFIMKDLPSGLTLYIFVSTLFGILQQLFVYRRVDA